MVLNELGLAAKRVVFEVCPIEINPEVLSIKSRQTKSNLLPQLVLWRRFVNVSFHLELVQLRKPDLLFQLFFSLFIYDALWISKENRLIWVCKLHCVNEEERISLKSVYENVSDRDIEWNVIFKTLHSYRNLESVVFVQIVFLVIICRNDLLKNCHFLYTFVSLSSKNLILRLFIKKERAKVQV